MHEQENASQTSAIDPCKRCQLKPANDKEQQHSKVTTQN
jgi:methylphosphotriester-DNA--protein-cysteine methyltransferase